MIVYGSYDQEALDAQYDNQRHAPGFAEIVATYARDSAIARKRFATRRDVPYGASPRETFDAILPAAGAPRPAPIHIFLHGGAWRSLSKDESAFAALSLAAAGAVVIAGDFDLATEVPLDTMVSQCRRLVAFIHRHARDFGGNPDRIALSGHSSGAHLAAMVAATPWRETHGLPDDLVKGVVLVSGLYDLEPVRLSYRNAMLKLDAEAARRSSPVARTPRPGLPVAIFAAEGDTAEFRRQARALAEHWSAAGAACRHREVSGRNHYDIALALADPETAIARACLAHLGL